MFRVHEYIKYIQVLSLESGFGSGSVQTAQVGGSPATNKRHALGSSRLVRAEPGVRHFLLGLVCFRGWRPWASYAGATGVSLESAHQRVEFLCRGGGGA